MQIFHSKFERFSGSAYKEVYKQALFEYKTLTSRSKRTPYVRSAYFNKGKIFIDLFWTHLRQKSWLDRMRRLKYFSCAIDLIQNSKIEPVIHIDSDLTKTVLYRFSGFTKSKNLFFVHIKHDLRSDKKWFISVFPSKKQ